MTAAVERQPAFNLHVLSLCAATRNGCLRRVPGRAYPDPAYDGQEDRMAGMNRRRGTWLWQVNFRALHAEKRAARGY